MAQHFIGKQLFSCAALLLLCLVATASKCGGDNAESAIPTTPEGIAKELCQHDLQGRFIASKILKASQERCLPTDPILAAPPFQAEACGTHSPLYLQYLAAIQAKRIVPNISKLRACQKLTLAARQGKTLAQTKDFLQSIESIQQSDACKGFLGASVAAGQVCSSLMECQGNLLCKQDPAQPTQLTCQSRKSGPCTNDSECEDGDGCIAGTCTSIGQSFLQGIGTIKEGDGCATTDECSPCLKCAEATGTGSDKHCVLPTLGIKCTSHGDCSSSSYCAGLVETQVDEHSYVLAKKGTCKERPISGPCYGGFYDLNDAAGVECAEGFSCIGLTKTKKGQCTKNAVAGESCETAECANGLVCIKETCVVSGGENLPCTKNVECNGLAIFGNLMPPSPYFCDLTLGKCVLRKTIGACDNSDTCAVGTKCKHVDAAATDNTCAPSGAGTFCQDEQGCDSHKCGSDNKCEADLNDESSCLTGSSLLLLAMMLPILRLRRRRQL